MSGFKTPVKRCFLSHDSIRLRVCSRASSSVRPEVGPGTVQKRNSALKSFPVSASRGFWPGPAPLGDQRQDSFLSPAGVVNVSTYLD